MDPAGFKKWISMVIGGLVVTIAVVLFVSLVLEQDWGWWAALVFGVFCAITGAMWLPKRSG